MAYITQVHVRTYRVERDVGAEGDEINSEVVFRGHQQIKGEQFEAALESVDLATLADDAEVLGREKGIIEA